MMKKLWMFIFLLSGNLFAADLNLSCVTETPTTTLVARTQNGLVHFDLIHHFGVKYMPIHNGVITPSDLGILSDRASLLADLGDQLTFTMPADNCQMDGLLFNCFGSNPSIEMGGHKVSLWAAYSSTVKETNLDSGQWNYTVTNLAIDVDGQTIFLPMKYMDGECSNDLRKNKSIQKYLR